MRRQMSWGLALLLALVVLSGCSGDGKEASSASHSTSVSGSVSENATTVSTASTSPAETTGSVWETSAASHETTGSGTAPSTSSTTATGTVPTSTTETFPPLSLVQTPTSQTAAVFGRTVIKDGRLRLEWSGSGFAVRVAGTQAKIFLNAAVEKDAQAPYVRVWVDGKERETTAVSGTVSIQLHLGAGEHLIQLVRLSEVLTVAPIHVVSLQVYGDRQMPPGLLSPPVLPQRRIEFIGDSITCGFGVTGQPYAVTGKPGRFLTEEEDVTKTYAGITAAYFGADARYIAASGRGVCHNHTDGGDSLLIPHLFDLASPEENTKWDFSLWQPQVVVINAGTNDYRGKTTPPEMRAGVKAFLEQVRRAYPDAEIIWMYGMMNKKLEEPLVQGIEDYNIAHSKKVHYLAVATLRGVQEQGALSHPNVAAQRDRAKPLQELITQLTGWKPA